MPLHSPGLFVRRSRTETRAPKTNWDATSMFAVAGFACGGKSRIQSADHIVKPLHRVLLPAEFG